MKDLGQEFENALEPQNDDDAADIFKVVQRFVWSNNLFPIYDQNS